MKQTKRQKNVFTSSSWGLVTPAQSPNLTRAVNNILYRLPINYFSHLSKKYVAGCSNFWVFTQTQVIKYILTYLNLRCLKVFWVAQQHIHILQSSDIYDVFLPSIISMNNSRHMILKYMLTVDPCLFSTLSLYFFNYGK